MLTIGIVNNMPPAAIPTTERHFRDLLAAACQNTQFQIRWFRFTGARPANYERLQDLWDSDLDGLIVTGAEPGAASLPDEPLWDPLTRTIEWAGRHTSSTIWSCLGAHAAVLYLDGVERRPRSEKIFGIFDSVKVVDHPILAGTQSVWRVPHSRRNDLSEHDLKTHGYKVLAKSQDAGVDLFVKQFKRSLFLFIQTHPEYDVGTLLREYRRDLARFNSAEQRDLPKIPRNYFDEGVIAELESIKASAPCEQKAGGLSILDRAKPPDGWKPFAAQLYRNWISHLLSARNKQPDERAAL
jgi:homoserine O-succinyltransferase/O-acetyltransferase